MYGTGWSLVPPIVAVLLAFITKEVYFSLFTGVFLGALFVAGFEPWGTFETLFTTMRESINLNIIIFGVLLDMVIVLMQKSGGARAYGNWAARKIKSKKSALFATTGLGVLIFIDDYFNCLTVGSVMRPVTDKYKVSRAKLAYIIDATAAPVCIIAPISSWAAGVSSYVPKDSSVTGFQLFLRTIPFNLYALLTLFMICLVVGLDLDFGLMKKHERNAEKGDLFTSGAEEFKDMAAADEEGNKNGKVIDLLLPVVVLIVSAVCGMVYTGIRGGATNFVDAFVNCNAEIGLIFAATVTIVFTAILYLPRKVLGFQEFMSSLADGYKLMVPAVLVLIFSWTLKGMGDQLGIGEFVNTTVGGGMAASIFIPAVMFGIALFLALSMGTSWGTFAILVPIVVEMFKTADENMMVIAVSAVLAGAVCGDHVSPISDTTILSSAGAQSNHINHVQTQMQYAMVVAVVCVIGYIIAGICKNWLITLALSAALLAAAIFAIKRFYDKRETV